MGGARAHAGRALLAGMLVLAAAASAHDVYIGYGRAELDGPEFRGQLAYNTLDLLQALEKTSGNKVYAMDPEEFDQLLYRYLQAHFQAVAADDTLALELLGRSQNADNVIFDFRFRGEQPLPGLRLRNDVLVDLFPEQVNTLTVSGPAGQSRHVFHADRRVVELAAPP